MNEPATPAPNPLAALPDWKQLMDTLFPDGKHVMHDVLGNEYPVRTVLPARREVLLVKKLAEVSDLPAGDWAAQMRGATTGNVSDMIGSLLGVVRSLAGEERVLTLLCEAVEIAHPQVLPAVLVRLRASEEGVAVLAGIDHPTLADVFDTTELVQALLPFVLRPASKAMAALNTLTPPPTT